MLLNLLRKAEVPREGSHTHLDGGLVWNHILLEQDKGLGGFLACLLLGTGRRGIVIFIVYVSRGSSRRAEGRKNFLLPSSNSICER